MILRSKYFVFLSLAFMLAASIYVYVVFNMEGIAFSAGSLILFIVTLAIYLIANTSKEKSPATNLKHNKDVIYCGPASHQKDESRINGMLFLLHDKLIFQSTVMRKIRQEKVITLNEIKEVSFAKTHRIHEKIVVIVTQTGQERFLVKADQLWLDEIENALMHNNLVNKGCEGKAI